MKRRTQIILIAAVLAGVAAASSVKRGGHCDSGKCGGGGACCPMLSGLNMWSTNAWAPGATTNGAAGKTGGEAMTNRER